MVTWRHTSPLYSGLALQVEISVAKELQVHFLANYAIVLVCQSLQYRLILILSWPSLMPNS